MFNEHTTSEALESRPPIMPSTEVLEDIQYIQRGEPLTFGATPVDLETAYPQQVALLKRLEKLVVNNVDKSIPADIREYMRDTFAMRFWGRANANNEKYKSALRTVDDLPYNPAAYEMIARAQTGHASPAELIIVGEMLGMQGIELGCVSHPYGKRIEQVEVMRRVVRDSIVALGGTPLDNEETRYRVRDIVNGPMWQSEEIDGFLMTRKRNVGIMPNGTIIRERTSFILRGDIDGIIPKESLDAIRQLDPKSPTWRTDVVTVGGLDVISAELLKADAFSLVIPVSSTIYAFNDAREAEIKARERKKKELERENNPIDWEKYPALLADYEEVREAQRLGHERDKKGMLVGFHVVPFGEDEISKYLASRHSRFTQDSENDS